MNKEPLNQKDGESEGGVPKYIFDKAWREGNFLIPGDGKLRMELRLKLEQLSRYKVMFRPENKKLREIIISRVNALIAFDRGTTNGHQ